MVMGQLTKQEGSLLLVKVMSPTADRRDHVCQSAVGFGVPMTAFPTAVGVTKGVKDHGGDVRTRKLTASCIDPWRRNG